MSDVAIVTGASSGIGFEIAGTLCGLGYEVYGFGRNFDTEDVSKPWESYPDKADGKFNENSNQKANEKADQKANDKFNENHNQQANNKFNKQSKGAFHQVSCDLLDTAKLEAQIRTIKKDHEVKVLVNNAGVGYYGLHEELNPTKIREMVRVNLEVPMVLTNLLLRDLKKSQGTIINISSVTASSSNPHGCAYGATKAGLTSFAHSLFDEARKYGVKVVNIQPDMAKTNLYRNANFTNADEEQAYLLPEDVAGAVEFILSQREGTVITDLTLKPQFHRIKRK